jgi:4-amino-4-deoxychorismate lyase
MCQLIESIRVTCGELQNIGYHNERFNRSRKELFGLHDEIDLSKLIVLPDNIDQATYKCRVIYSKILHNIEFQPYIQRNISSLKMVNVEFIDYSYKYLNRNCFTDKMIKIEADDILIVKNGFITDTSFSNIVFFDGSNWVTPSTYLLNGTMRRYLLDTNKIISRLIIPEDLKNFESAKLINAMLGLDNSQVISVGNIIF